MKQKDDTGPEIEPWEMEEPKHEPADASVDQDEETKKISRHSFRGPVSKVDAIEVRINDQKYGLVDIGSRGIGITLPEADIFAIDDVVSVNLLLLEELPIQTPQSL